MKVTSTSVERPAGSPPAKYPCIMKYTGEVIMKYTRAQIMENRLAWGNYQAMPDRKKARGALKFDPTIQDCTNPFLFLGYGNSFHS